MAFTLEDGTGIIGSNAYISEAFFDMHHTDRGRDMANLTAVVKEAAIVRASDYIDKRYGRWFRGFRKRKRQGMEWPRLDAYDNDDYALNELDNVPRQLQKACAEYAIRAIIYATELAPDPLRPTPQQDMTDASNVTQSKTNISGQIRRKEDEVTGAVRQAITYDSWTEIVSKLRDTINLSALVSLAYIPAYPEADLWLEELLTSMLSRRIVRGS